MIPLGQQGLDHNLIIYTINSYFGTELKPMIKPIFIKPYSNLVDN